MMLPDAEHFQIPLTVFVYVICTLSDKESDLPVWLINLCISTFHTFTDESLLTLCY